MAASGGPLSPLERARKKGPPPPPPPKMRRTRLSTEDSSDERMESKMNDTKHMTFVDGRCSCCPYGYHIDLDFMRYLEDMNSTTTLRKLKKIHRDKKKLRKSMEVFLKNQELMIANEGMTPPPDVVNSSESYMHMVDPNESAANDILEEIDSSVNATLSSIDLLMHSGKKKPGDISDSDFELESPSPSRKGQFTMPLIDQRYRSETEFLLSGRELVKSDSVSSVSSQSTFSGDQFSPNSSSSHAQQTMTSRTMITSSMLADNMTSLFPGGDQLDGGDLSQLSPQTLQAIRQQMAISLQRMRELEEQVKAIPVLQVRISVLKEEKRLLMLQLKAKSSKLNMRSIGTGDARIDHSDYGLSSSSHITQMNINMKSQMNGDIYRPAMRSIGVGDFNVYENALIQSVSGIVQTAKVHERELHTEQNTHVHEKEIKTVFLGQSEGNEALNFRPKVAPKPAKKPSRSIGVGDGNVFDANSNVHFHQKELRTVFIGQDEKDKPTQRNVGILCKAATRDVGVTYMYEDELPPHRSIAVGAGEMGINGELLFEGEPGEFGAGAQSTTNIYSTLQQMNMAAFHSKHIHIKDEMLRAIIDEKLKKSVHSKSTQCAFATENKGVQAKGLDNKVNVGVGEDSVDVVVGAVKQTRSVAIENRPMTFNRLTTTDKIYTMDMGTNTLPQLSSTTSRSTNTAPVLSYPAATNTEAPSVLSSSTETELRVFQAMNQVKNSAVNTQAVRTSDSSSNTEHHKQLDNKNFDFSISFGNKGVKTDVGAKHTWDRGVNTQEIRLYDKGSNTQPMHCQTRGVNTERKLNQTTRGVNTDTPRSYGKTTGDTSSSETVTTKTNVQVIKVTECENCKERYTDGIVNAKRHMSESSLDKSKEAALQEKGVLDSGSRSELSKVITREIVRKTESKLGTSPRTSGSSFSSQQDYTTSVHDAHARDGVLSSSASSTSSSQNQSALSMTSSQESSGSSRDGAYLKGSRSQDSEGLHEIDMLHGGSGGMKVTRTVETRSSAGGGSYSQGPASQGSEASHEIDMLYGGSGGSRTKVIRTVETRSSSGGGSYSQGSGSQGSERSHEFDMLHGGSGGSRAKVIRTVETRSSGGGSYSQGSQGSRSQGSERSHEIDMLHGGSGGSRAKVIRTVETRSSSGGGSYSQGSQGSRSQGSDGSGQIEMMMHGDSGGSGTKVLRQVETRSTRDGALSQGSRSQASEGSDEFEMLDGGSGGTKMKVIRHVETTYVGGHPVNRSSNVEIRDPADAVSSSTSKQTTSQGGSHSILQSVTGGGGGGGGGGAHRTVHTSTVVRRTVDGQVVEERTTSSSDGSSGIMQDSGITLDPTTPEMEFADSMDLAHRATLPESGGGVRGKRVVVTETRVERTRGDSNGGLRSIMKQPGTLDSSSKSGKKEISFSEEVTGGYASTSEEEIEDEEADIEGAVKDMDESASDSGDDGQESPDEGSYDGRIGQIVHTCKDNEAIEQGQPGAVMYDQNIRETFELGEEMRNSCAVYAQWLEDSTQVNSKQLNSSLNIIQQEWFKASSHKLSNASQVEDYLTCFNEISHGLLVYIVNMADANGNTALHYAVSHCNMEIVNLLLDTESLEVNKQNNAGYTAVMLAALTQIQTDRERSIVRRLFTMADVNVQASQAGQTALMLAVSHGRADMVAMLLECGASVNIQDEDGSTALMCASEHGHHDIVKMLLAHPDTDASLTDNDNSTALSIAMEAGHREIGVLLYAHLNFKQGSPVLSRNKLKKKSSSRSSSTSSISSQS